MYALNRWDVYAQGGDAGVPDTKLKLAEYCDSTVGKSFTAFKDGLGSLDNPWSAETVGSDIADWSLEALAAYQLGPKGEAPKIEKSTPCAKHQPAA